MKTHILTKLTFFKTNLSVFGETHGRPLNTIKKTFSGNMLYYFLMLIKNTFFIILRLVHKKLPLLFSNVFSRYNTYLIERKKGLFLDVHLITRFFEGQNRYGQQK